MIKVIRLCSNFLINGRVVMVSLSVSIQKIAIENHSEYASSSTATLSEFNFATSLLSPSLYPLVVSLVLQILFCMASDGILPNSI
jgi:hypothetical protein